MNEVGRVAPRPPNRRSAISFPVIILLRGVDDLLGASGDKFLKLLRLVRFDFSGCLSCLALKFSRLGLDTSQLRIVPGLGRFQRSNVVVHELGVGLNEGVNVRITESGQIVGQRVRNIPLSSCSALAPILADYNESA